MKDKPFKIIISSDGTITSVYSDTMNLHRIGLPNINRATEVKFNNKEKYWEVIGIPPYFCRRLRLCNEFLCRIDAINWEIEYLNKHMERIIEAEAIGGYNPREAKSIKRKSRQI